RRFPSPLSDDLSNDPGLRRANLGCSARDGRAPYLRATSVRVVKLRRVSAGYSMSFLPVAAAPAVPAPSPAPAPMAAPLPPPASPPISAPAAAPPPMKPASRLPLPFSVRPEELVVSAYVSPFTVMVRSRR